MTIPPVRAQTSDSGTGYSNPFALVVANVDHEAPWKGDNVAAFVRVGLGYNEDSYSGSEEGLGRSSYPCKGGSAPPALPRSGGV